MKKKYKGVETESNGQTYYERAFDAKGEGILIGDKVKIVASGDTQLDLKGNVMYVIGIFEGDLMVSHKKHNAPYFYCWPYKVLKVGDK